MKTEPTDHTTVITAHTTVLGAVRAHLANATQTSSLIGRDGIAQHIESLSRVKGSENYRVYIATGPADNHEDGDGTPPTEVYMVHRDRKVVVRVEVYDRVGGNHQLDVTRIKRILRATHVAGQSYPGE